MLRSLRIPVSSRVNEHFLDLGQSVDFNLLRNESLSPTPGFLLMHFLLSKVKSASLLLPLAHLGVFLSLAVIEES